MKNVALDEIEYRYIIDSDFIPHAFLLNLKDALINEDGKYLLEINETKSDEFRDLLIERLQLRGFDANYKITSEGMILERLIDKFYIE